MKCRFIDSGENSPYMNMAVDEALLNSNVPVLRAYSWKPAGLSIGYSQQIKEINQEFCMKNHIKIVRRITGGKAVLHENELTYSFIIDVSEIIQLVKEASGQSPLSTLESGMISEHAQKPLNSQKRQYNMPPSQRAVFDEKLMPISIIDSYKVISKGILNALKLLGIDARMNDVLTKEEKSEACFNDPNWYEITANKKKIVGSAQKRTQGKLLQHGSVLIDINAEKYAMCFNQYNDESLKKINQRITTINLELGSILSYNIVAKAMKKGFSEALNLELVKSELSAEERQLAENLNHDKYSTLNWNSRI